MSLGANFNDRNFKHLSGNYPQVYGNIATTKLIQCGIAEMPENKAFHGFCGFVFSFFEPVSVCWEQLRFLILHHFLTIAGIVKRFEWGGAEPYAGSDKKYLTAAQAAISH